MSAVQNDGLDYSQRAAVLLMTVGEEAASEVLKHMGPKEVQKIGVAMTTIGEISKETVKSVLEEFLETANSQTAVGMGAEDYIRKI